MKIMQQPITRSVPKEGVALFASDWVKAKYTQPRAEQVLPIQVQFHAKTFIIIGDTTPLISEAFQRYGKSEGMFQNMLNEVGRTAAHLSFIQARTSTKQLQQLSKEEFIEHFTHWHRKYLQLLHAIAEIELVCEGSTQWLQQRIRQKCTTPKQQEAALSVLLGEQRDKSMQKKAAYYQAKLKLSSVERAILDRRCQCSKYEKKHQEIIERTKESYKLFLKHIAKERGCTVTKLYPLTSKELFDWLETRRACPTPNNKRTLLVAEL